jgi:hypothetical protein
MKVQGYVLALALGSTLGAQSPLPVQGVGKGLAKPNFVNAYGSNTVQNGVKAPVLRNQGSMRPMSAEEYKELRARAATRARSADEASIWVRQYSPPANDATTVDGRPKFSTTVTLRQIHGDARSSENVTPHFTATLLRNLSILSNLPSLLPGGGGSHDKK